MELTHLTQIGCVIPLSHTQPFTLPIHVRIHVEFKPARFPGDYATTTTLHGDLGQEVFILVHGEHIFVHDLIDGGIEKDIVVFILVCKRLVVGSLGRWSSS